MQFKDIINKMDDESYKALKLALEIGKFKNGQVLTAEQKAHAMQALIAYEIEHDFPEDQRVGYIDTGSSDCHKGADVFETPLKWQK